MTEGSVLLIASTCLGALLVAAAASDLRARRVSNGLNVIVLSSGVLYTMFMHGPATGARAVLLGVGLMLLIWFPMFALRLMGAGDVKLLAASGAWLGWQGALVATLATGVIGGVLGAFWLLRSQGALSALHTLSTAVRAPWLMKMRPFEARERIPYALAVAGGVSVAWWSLNSARLSGLLA